MSLFYLLQFPTPHHTPPPRHPDAFPLATSKRQHASYNNNNNSLSQQTRKTKNSHTNQPASQRQAKVSNEQRMHAKTTTITAAARQKAKRGPPADRLHPQIKKNKNNKLVLPTPTHPLHLAPASLPRKYFSPPPDPPFHQRQPRDYGPGGVVGIGLLVLPWRRKLLIVD